MDQLKNRYFLPQFFGDCPFVTQWMQFKNILVKTIFSYFIIKILLYYFYMSSYHQVHNLTSPILLRFKYQQQKKTRQISLTKNTSFIKGIFQACKRRIRSLSKQIESTNQRSTNEEPLVIKFVEVLTNNTFIIGSSHKLDIIEISHKQNNYIQAKKILEIKTDFKINRIIYENKRCHLIVSGNLIFQIYKIDFKKVQVNKSSYFQTNKILMFSELYNENILIVFYQQSCTIFNIETSNVVIKQHHEYQNKTSKVKIFAVPKIFQKYLNIFFYEKPQLNSDKNLKYSIYKAQLSLQSTEFNMSPIMKIYELKQSQFTNLKIFNYNKQTILLNLKYEIIPIVRNYPIEQSKHSFWNEKSVLEYYENRTLMHILPDKIEVYQYLLEDKNVIINSKDVIEIEVKKNYSYFKAVFTDNNNFFFIYVLNNNKCHRQIKYCFLTTIPEKIENKLKKLFQQQFSKAKFREQDNQQKIKQIQNYASKFGLSKTSIFMELWTQSPKKSKIDYNLLLETQNYKLISYQVKKRLKKSSLKFKDIERIQKECFRFLTKQIKQNPTEKNILHYLKSNMMLRKYKVQKILKTSQKHQKNQNEQSKKGFQLSYQDYESIRRRNIKKYIIQLLENIQEVKNIEIIKIYLDQFKSIFRITFIEFITQIIEQFQDKFYSILCNYPEILPFYHQYFPGYPQYGGIWADINSHDWDHIIHYQKIKNIDNINILNDFMKTEKFRWDFLVRHDFVRLNKKFFQKQFIKLRTQNIYYVVFDRLFSTLQKKEEILIKIIKKIQSIYEIPQHLRGKLFLYWQMYDLLQNKNQFFESKFLFEQFLKLKQEDIYEKLFNNQKNLKKFILNQIKTIYASTENVFSDSIRNYFKSNLSKISDLKYLLNRINNYKVQSHNINEELYKVLLESAFYKLQWQNKYIPIKQLTIYFQNIPMDLYSLNQLNKLEILQQYASILSNLDMNINLITFFQNPKIFATTLTASFLSNFDSISLYKKDETGMRLIDVISFMQQIRGRLNLANFSDSIILSQIFSFILNYEELIPSLEILISQQKILKLYNIEVDNFLIELVQNKINQVYKISNSFSSNQKYIRLLLSLVKTNSNKKMQIQSHLNLGLILSVLQKPVKAPLEFSSRYIQQILYDESSIILKKLNFDQIFDHMIIMGINYKKINLYEFLIIKFIEQGEWIQALRYANLWNIIQSDNTINFSSVLIAMRIGEQLSKDIRLTLIEIILNNFYNRRKLIHHCEKLISIKETNERRFYLKKIQRTRQLLPEYFYDKNWLLSEEFKKENMARNRQQIKYYFQSHILPFQREFQIDLNYLLYYRLLFTDPMIAFDYQKKKFQLQNIQKIKTIASNLAECKYFDQIQLKLFFYKSIYFSFLSYYLSIEFVQLLHQFKNWTFQEMENFEKERMKALSIEMRKSGELQNYEIIRWFRKNFVKVNKTNLLHPLNENQNQDHQFGMKKQLSTHNISISSIKRVSIKSRRSLVAVDFIDIERQKSKLNSDFDNNQNKKSTNTNKFDVNQNEQIKLMETTVRKSKIVKSQSHKRFLNCQKKCVKNFNVEEDNTNKVNYDYNLQTKMNQIEIRINNVKIDKIIQHQNKNKQQIKHHQSQNNINKSQELPLIIQQKNKHAKISTCQSLKSLIQNFPISPNSALENQQINQKNTNYPSHDYQLKVISCDPCPEKINKKEQFDEQITKKLILLLSDGDFEKVQQLCGSQMQVTYIKRALVQLYKSYSLSQFIKIVQGLSKKKQFLKKIIRPKNLIILKNSAKLTVNFDCKLIFDIQFLYKEFLDTNLLQFHKEIFKYLEPKILKILSTVNVFVLSRVIYLLLGYNKYFEHLIQFYYLQNLICIYLKTELSSQEQKMERQKIVSFLIKFPISLILQRFQKLNQILMQISTNHKCQDKSKIKNLIKILLKSLGEKKEIQNRKYALEIDRYEKNLNELYNQSK